MSDVQESSGPIVVAYALKDVLAVYWGELVEVDTTTAKDHLLCLGKPMVMLLNPKNSDEMAWTKPIACGQDSVICLETDVTPGTFVFKPDQELVAKYKYEYTQAYTRLTLLR